MIRMHGEGGRERETGRERINHTFVAMLSLAGLVSMAPHCLLYRRKAPFLDSGDLWACSSFDLISLNMNSLSALYGFQA